MKTLQRMLTRAFRPAPARAPDVHRKARERAKPLAAQHGITIERSHGALAVWPQRGFNGRDPWAGDHYCDDWSDVLVMVLHYSGVEPYIEPT